MANASRTVETCVFVRLGFGCGRRHDFVQLSTQQWLTTRDVVRVCTSRTGYKYYECVYQCIVRIYRYHEIFRRNRFLFPPSFFLSTVSPWFIENLGNSRVARDFVAIVAVANYRFAITEPTSSLRRRIIFCSFSYSNDNKKTRFVRRTRKVYVKDEKPLLHTYSRAV